MNEIKNLKSINSDGSLELDNTTVSDNVTRGFIQANSGLTITADPSNNNYYYVIVDNNTIIDLNTPMSSSTTVDELTILLKQDPTGSWTVGWNGTIQWDNSASALPSNINPSAVTIFKFIRYGNTAVWYGRREYIEF